MFVDAIRKASKSMFPIFSWDQQPNQLGIGVAGTGFFINSSGYFITVAHLFDNSNIKYRYWGLLPETITNPAVEIEEVARDDDNDVFVGRVPGIKGNRFLQLASWTPRVGKSVCISGYPMASIGFDQQAKQWQLGGVRRYYQPSFVLDIGQWRSNTNGKIRNHNGFLVRDVGLFGMSGGPIFDIRGNVLGIQGSVATRSSSNGQQSITVYNAAAIKSTAFIELLEKNRIKCNK
jgi:S1-C subfamily serine protease